MIEPDSAWFFLWPHHPKKYIMEKLDLLAQMNHAWQEADEHCKTIAQLMEALKAEGKPTLELTAQLAVATKQYDEAMHRYKRFSEVYQVLAVELSN